MNYLIGGSARCGKTELAKKLRLKLGTPQTLSGDALRHALKGQITQKDFLEYDVEDEKGYLEFYAKHTDHAVDQLHRQGQQVWPYIEKYISGINFESDADLVVDGIDIWPDLIKQAGFNFRVVFLIDTSVDQWGRVIKYRDEKHDWLFTRNFTEKQIKAWAALSANRSRLIQRLCSEYNYPCFDVAELGYDSAQNMALDSLLRVS